jgi:hypothetical protein
VRYTRDGRVEITSKHVIEITKFALKFRRLREHCPELAAAFGRYLDKVGSAHVPVDRLTGNARGGPVGYEKDPAERDYGELDERAWSMGYTVADANLRCVPIPLFNITSTLLDAMLVAQGLPVDE